LEPESSDNDKQDQAYTGPSDEYGALEIPSKLHFFFVLTKRSLYVLTARDNDLARTRKSMEISWTLPYDINDDTGIYSGGLVEGTTGSLAGVCWKLYFDNNSFWDMCAETIEKRTEWMNVLASVMTKMGKKAVLPAVVPEDFSMKGSSKDYDD
jgi:hypothetical protein